MNFASVVQSGNFIFCLLSFCADKGFRCSKEEEVKNQSAIFYLFGILMFVAQSRHASPTLVCLCTRQDFIVKQVFVSMVYLVAFYH
jgi:hypothetical protein